MNKYKLIGTLIATALLIASLLLRGSGAEISQLALPLLCLGAWVLVLFDTIAYRSSKGKLENMPPMARRTELMRLVALYVISSLISIGAIINLISG